MKELADLQAGDEVVWVRKGYGESEYLLVRVERATATMLVVNGTKFRRKDGRQMGGHSILEGHLELRSVTPQELCLVAEYAATERRRTLQLRVREICKADIRWLSEESAKEILAILEREKPTRGEAR